MLEKLKFRIQQVADTAQKIATDSLLTEKVPEGIQTERWNICLSCDNLIRPTSTCKLCGCFMQVKTWMPHRECPIKKWHIHKF